MTQFKGGPCGLWGVAIRNNAAQRALNHTKSSRHASSERLHKLMPPQKHLHRIIQSLIYDGHHGHLVTISVCGKRGVRVVGEVGVPSH